MTYCYEIAQCITTADISIPLVSTQILVLYHLIIRLLIFIKNVTHNCRMVVIIKIIIAFLNGKGAIATEEWFCDRTNI